jgi:hypothetical protein
MAISYAKKVAALAGKALTNVGPKPLMKALGPEILYKVLATCPIDL